MARVKNEENNEQFKEIGKWKLEKKTSHAVYAGVCAMCGWVSGKEVTEKEYDEAVKDFMSGGY